MIYINPGYKDFFTYYNNNIDSFTDFLESTSIYAKENGLIFTSDSNNFTLKHRNNTLIFNFRNDFFKIITLQSVVNWVDIENIYYEILVDLVKGQSISARHKYLKSIDILNNEFNQVKSLLEDYLSNEIIDKYDYKSEPIYNNQILDFFRIRACYLKDRKDHELFFEFPPEDHEELIEFDEKVIELGESRNYNKQVGDDIKWQESLFLDFNYTKTGENYATQINSRNYKDYGNAIHIQIHGKIKSKDNEINFGFGDEMDDDYKLIEKKGNNEYLKNIKSFQYLHTSNYRKLLNWIETDKFQVYIFGHSCGLSDRTLLNTIFENNNCRSIKIFYYKNEEGSNYTELTHNISRHFNKKSLMRRKIVDKTLCIALPQNIRFKEKTKP